MAESDGGQDKTEEPTQKRLEKAAEDGQIASSKELFVFTTLAMGFLLYYAILFVLPRLLIEWRSFFQFGDTKFLFDEIIRLSSMAFSFLFINSTFGFFAFIFDLLQSHFQLFGMLVILP